MRDLHRDWEKWTRTERFSAVIIFVAVITVIIPAAIEFTRQSTIAPRIQHSMLTLAR